MHRRVGCERDTHDENKIHYFFLIQLNRATENSTHDHYSQDLNFWYRFYSNFHVESDSEPSVLFTQWAHDVATTSLRRRRFVIRRRPISTNLRRRYDVAVENDE